MVETTLSSINGPLQAKYPHSKVCKDEPVAAFNDESEIEMSKEEQLRLINEEIQNVAKISQELAQKKMLLLSDIGGEAEIQQPARIK